VTVYDCAVPDAGKFEYGTKFSVSPVENSEIEILEVVKED